MSERATKIHSEVKKLITTVKELQSQLAQSVPKAEHDTMKAKAVSELEIMEKELKEARQSRPLMEETVTLLRDNGTVEARRAADLQKSVDDVMGLSEKCVQKIESIEVQIGTMPRLHELESQISNSVSRSSAEELKNRVLELEMSLSETIPKVEASARINELEGNLTAKDGENERLRNHIRQLESELSSMMPRAEADSRVFELEERLRELEQAINQLRSNIIDNPVAIQSGKASELETQVSQISSDSSA